MLKVRGYRVLVKPDPVETVSKGGIIMVLDEKLERSGQQFGVVIGLGHTCWANRATDGEFVEQERWCKEGDRVLYSKHAGRFVYDPDTEEELMIMNDDDILAVVRGEKDDG